MIGFLVWDTGNVDHPMSFVYANDREDCKQALVKYLVNVHATNWFNPDNWVIEPVTREQDYVTKNVVICPNINKLH